MSKCDVQLKEILELKHNLNYCFEWFRKRTAIKFKVQNKISNCQILPPKYYCCCFSDQEIVYYIFGLTFLFYKLTNLSVLLKYCSY